MAREERETLERIAVDMVVLSMQHMGPNTRGEAWKQVQGLTDTELVSWICD